MLLFQGPGKLSLKRTLAVFKESSTFKNCFERRFSRYITSLKTFTMTAKEKMLERNCNMFDDEDEDGRVYEDILATIDVLKFGIENYLFRSATVDEICAELKKLEEAPVPRVIREFSKSVVNVYKF